MNCPNCKNEVKNNSKYCRFCGTQLEVVDGEKVPLPCEADSTLRTEPEVTNTKIPAETKSNIPNTDVKPMEPTFNQAPIISSNSAIKTEKSHVVLLGIIAIIAFLLIGGGVFYMSGGKLPTEIGNAIFATVTKQDSSLKQDNKIESKKSVAKDDSLDDDKKRLEAASSIVRKMGFNQLVTSTSYGNSSHGFMAIVGGSVMIFDTDNNRAATIFGVGPLMEFKRQVENHETGPVIVNFAVWNDTQDKDVRAGWWEGNRHHIPIYMLWRYENGKILDNGLYTARGRNASHYHEYLYEMKNCDLAFLFYTEAIPLIKDANKHGALKK